MISPNVNSICLTIFAPQRKWFLYVSLFFFLVSFSLCVAKGASSDTTIETFSVPDTIKLKFLFPMRMGEFDPSFHNNQQKISQLDELFQHGAAIRPSTYILIQVGASPEGAWGYNKKLIDQRMKSIYRFLKERYPHIVYSRLLLQELAIDWKSIVQHVNNDADFPFKKKTLAILMNDWNVQKKETALRALGNGLVFARLKEFYLPAFRKAEMTVSNPDAVPSSPVIQQSLVSTDGPLPKSDASLLLTVNKNNDSLPATSLARSRYYSQYASVSLKTNLLLDAALMPNVAVEIPLGKKISFNAEWIFPWWSIPSKHYYYQMLAGNIEARYWFNPRSDYRGYMNGWFAGLFGGSGSYDFELGNIGYQGDSYLATGLTLGYVHRIGKTLGLEYSLGLGYLKSKYRKYDVIDNCYYWQSDGDFRWVGPVKANVTLIWSPKFLVSKKRLK